MDAAGAEGALDSQLERLWEIGWTPNDVVRVVRRLLSNDVAAVVAGRSVEDGRRRSGEGRPPHPRWQGQLDELEAWRVGTPASPADPRLTEAVRLLRSLPRQPRVMPPPGETDLAVEDRGTVDQRALTRVRALLAKAESTTFGEEAEALTTKAQELMARHAIDEALLTRGDEVGRPSARRITVEAPYADAKATLITSVAEAGACRAVHQPAFGWVTVLGYGQALLGVEVLVTSLTLQATERMLRHGAQVDRNGRSRTRAFRRAFLFGFATRIGQRLRQATWEQVEATDDERLLPVLAARGDRLDSAVREAFPDLRNQRATTTDPRGWDAGASAAEQAHLDDPRRHLSAR